MKTFFSTILATLMFLTGPGIAGDDGAQGAGPATVCEEPRPQVCTMDYRPVCGTLADGSVKTYANGCGACSDASVASWVEAACPQ